MTLHVECGEAQPTLEIGGALRWRETLAGGATTVAQAPPPTQPDRVVVFTLVPEASGWVSIGQAPDANNVLMRRRMLSGLPRSFVAPEGARVMWVVG